LHLFLVGITGIALIIYIFQNIFYSYYYYSCIGIIGPRIFYLKFSALNSFIGNLGSNVVAMAERS